MAIIARLKALLHRKKKQIVVSDAATLTSGDELQQESSLPELKQVEASFVHYATLKSNEVVYLNTLCQAAHHPQVLSIKHSLRLDVPDNVYARRLVGRVFEGVLRPEKETPPPVTSTPLPEHPAVAVSPVSATETAIAVVPVDNMPTVFMESSVAAVEAPAVSLITSAPLKNRPLTIYDFREEGYVGSGTWGHVHLARHRGTGLQVAMKSIQKSAVAGKEAQVLKEQATLRAVAGQDGVLDLLGSFQDDSCFYIITRYYAGGDFDQLLEDFSCVPEPLFPFYAAQLLVCLERVHACGVVHRDLKPANFFIDKSGNLAIGDFGLAVFVEDLENIKSEISGTVEYIAREVWQSQGGCYSYATDVWAYAVNVFEMATGRTPWDSQKCKSLKGMINIAIAGLDEWMGDDVISDDLCDFLDSVFEADADERPTLSELKKHRFFKSIDWEALEAGKLPVPISIGALEEEDSEQVDKQLEDDLPYEPSSDDVSDEDDQYPEFNFISDALIQPLAPAAAANSALHSDLAVSLADQAKSSAVDVVEVTIDYLHNSDLSICSLAQPSVLCVVHEATDFLEPSYAIERDSSSAFTADETEDDSILLTPSPALLSLPAFPTFIASNSEVESSLSAIDKDLFDSLHTSSPASSPATTNDGTFDDDLLLTPSPELLSAPTFPAFGSSMLLGPNVFHDIPLDSHVSLTAFTIESSPYPTCHSVNFLHSTVAKRRTVVVNNVTSIIDSIVPARSQICHILGDEENTEDRYDDWEHSTFPSSEDLGSPRRTRILARLKAWKGKLTRSRSL